MTTTACTARRYTEKMRQSPGGDLAQAPGRDRRAILGSAIPLARALTQPRQYAVLAGAAVLLLLLRPGVGLTLLAARAAGRLIALAGGPVPH